MEERDQLKLENSYIAGFFDGDGSICIGKCKGGFQLKAEITQCNETFLNQLNTIFKGKLYKDHRKDKYNKESAFHLRMCGAVASPILKLVEEFGIIKSPQASIALRYLSHAHQQGMYEIRSSFYATMQSMNRDKSSYPKVYSPLNSAYIAGLFDAEGNVYNAIIKNKHKYYVKITQKSDPLLLVRIQEFLGAGKIPASESYRLIFYSKTDIAKLWDAVKPYIVNKKPQYIELLRCLDLVT